VGFEMRLSRAHFASVHPATVAGVSAALRAPLLATVASGRDRDSVAMRPISRLAQKHVRDDAPQAKNLHPRQLESLDQQGLGLAGGNPGEGTLAL
jgi:hypothetical protein